jgi:hypothetical protein
MAQTGSMVMGTEAASNLLFITHATEAARLDSSGNLGLGVTPPAIGSNRRALVIGGQAVASVYHYAGIGESAYNWYLDAASAVRYATTNYAGTFEFNNSATGGFAWKLAPSGTAGNAITFTQAMTLDASGNLSIGNTSATSGAKLDVNGAIRAGTGANQGFEAGWSSGASYIYVQGYDRTASTFQPVALTGSDLRFLSGSSPTERARIDSSGNLLVGTTSGNSRLRVLSTASQSQSAYITHPTFDQDVISCENSATSGDNRFISFYTDATVNRGNISYNRGAGLVAYNVTSDYRAKDINGPVTNSGSLIDSVPVYMGKMKGATQERPMFIAHETPAYAHTGEKDAVDKDGKPVYQQMDASALIPVMWAEIQSLRKRLADAGI